MCDLMMYYETEKIAVIASIRYDMLIVAIVFCPFRISKDSELLASECPHNANPIVIL